MSRAPSDGVSRRHIFALGGALAATGAATGAAGSATPPAHAQPPGAKNVVGGETTHVTLTEGANIAFSVSPRGDQVAFDLCGVLWLCPIAGGVARPLTEPVLDIAQPDWSPDGRHIVFQSFRDGTYQLWRIRVDGTELEALTSGPFDCREPRFSPDGARLAFACDRGGSYGVHLLDLSTRQITALIDGPGEEYEPSWSPDGLSLAYVIDRRRIEVCDLAGNRREVASVPAGGGPRAPGLPQNTVSSPVFTPDGKDVWFVRGEGARSELHSARSGLVVGGQEVFPVRAAWLAADELLYAADGRLRRRTLAGQVRDIPFSATVDVVRPRYAKTRRAFDAPGDKAVMGIGSPVLSPRGDRIAFRALNDLWVVDAKGGAPVALTRDSFHKSDPGWSPDGQSLVYSTDRAGTLDLWIRDLSTGQDRRLTRFDGAATSCVWSPDGKTIAFLNQNGALHLVSVADGATRKLAGDLYQPGRPSWSPDGRTIAMAAFKPYSARFREGLNEVMTVDVETGEALYQPILPHRSIATRGDDGPVWSPDGRHLAFVFASRLYLAPVDAKGKMRGAPRPITDEVTDAPSWSADSASLLYLSLGKLRVVAATGGAPKTIPLRMTYANARPTGRTIVHAGQLWDGKSPTLRQDVDLILDGARIAAIAPHDPRGGDQNARRIDARQQTVMPGLIDMHAHHQMQGYGYGDRSGRLWLAMGITTTRAPANPAYHMVEAREAIDSGLRIGPRCYGTGEALDGARIYYNFMRSVTEPGQMALEMQRAKALSYDLIKTYVRLSPPMQKAAIEWAHAHGMHVTGHYHYPALAFGADGMEHMGATNRLGYSRTVGASGRVYQDAHALFMSSGAPRTPTLFQASALFPDDPSLLEDVRVKTLYPPWEYARLKARAEAMAKVDRAPILEALARNVEELKRTVRAGGAVVTGTDSPIDFNVVSLHMNLRAMVRYGMTPFEALVTTTSASAKYLDAPLGVLEAGAFADVAIVDGDPLTRIEDAANVAWVIKHGQVFTVAELMAPFTGPIEQAQASAPRFVCEAVSPYWWHHPDYLSAGLGGCCDGSGHDFMRV
jgi:Tol biopolymer transport system component/cytosine/adenosine deaminase-related metal-dependent hydrolase